MPTRENQSLACFRKALTTSLWNQYKTKNQQAQAIERVLINNHLKNIVLDHFAIIDLPSVHSGISHLKEIFTILGYEQKGQGYLASKQNDFIWIAEDNCENYLAEQTVPQIVLADFRIEEMPIEIRNIIYDYSKQIKPPELALIKRLAEAKDFLLLKIYLLSYFSGRDWSLASKKDFETVREFNELLAWVLVYGRQPNHFTIAVHLLKAEVPLIPTVQHSYFNDLHDFQIWLSSQLAIAFNHNGSIQGNAMIGICQSSTLGEVETLQAADGEIELRSSFMEFAWRYAKNAAPVLWGDYFTGFLPQHADNVIESLYSQEEKI